MMTRPARGIAPAAAAVIAAAAVVSALGACSASDQAQPAARGGNVTLTAAQRRTIELVSVAESGYHRTVDANGTVDFDNEQATSVLAPFSGPVTRLLVSPGQQVREGDPLALVDSPDFATAVSAYQKALATARTDRRLSDQDQDLLQHNGVSAREAAQAETDAVSAEADRDAALQALVSLKVSPATLKDLDAGRPIAHPQAPIRSPLAGTVVERLITPGELLQAGTTPCFTVANLSRVWVMAQLFGSDLAAISVGDTATVTTGIGPESFPGKVDNIAALVDPDTRSVRVRVVADNPGNRLKKQMYVRVLIRARQESRGLLIPVSSVLRDDENLPFVYVAQPDGSFARRRVLLGYRAGEQYEVTDGLRAGDQLVVAGGIFVQFIQTQ
jgi:membrane fusion protein, heavy metal efflux system